LGCCF
jgi:chorismate--pyruvate lyase